MLQSEDQKTAKFMYATVATSDVLFRPLEELSAFPFTHCDVLT